MKSDICVKLSDVDWEVVGSLVIGWLMVTWDCPSFSFSEEPPSQVLQRLSNPRKKKKNTSYSSLHDLNLQ